MAKLNNTYDKDCWRGSNESGNNVSVGQELWLREETRNEKVVSSNPGAVNWMDIFHIDSL